MEGEAAKNFVRFMKIALYRRKEMRYTITCRLNDGFDQGIRSGFRILVRRPAYAPVAQMDRALDSDSKGLSCCDGAQIVGITGP